jgi:hypothetical protein
VLENYFRHQSVSLECKFAARVGELDASDMAPHCELRLTQLERGKDEQICLFIKPRLADANPVHDTFAKRQLSHFYFLSAIEGKDL